MINQVQHTQPVQSYSWTDRLKVVGKITLVALCTIACFAASAAAIYFALPLVVGASVGLSAVGYGIIGAAALFALGAVIAPFADCDCEYRYGYDKKTVFSLTDHNVKDCFWYINNLMTIIVVLPLLGFVIIAAGAYCCIGCPLPPPSAVPAAAEATECACGPTEIIVCAVAAKLGLCLTVAGLAGCSGND